MEKYKFGALMRQNTTHKNYMYYKQFTVLNARTVRTNSHKIPSAHKDRVVSAPKTYHQTNVK